MSLPKTMRAWQYSAMHNGIENSVKLNNVPLLEPKPNQHLVKVLYASVNPFDYKPVEIPGVARFAISKPATPGTDFAGRIVIPAPGSPLKAGQLVFGATQGTSLLVGGAFREYATCDKEQVALVPARLSIRDAASICIAGLSGYQPIVPHVKAGDKVFINGGSGGVGTFGIQIAKIRGCHVTTTCSTANVELCKSLGADEVIDYKKQNILDILRGGNYDKAVDNILADWSLFFKSHEYLKPGAVYQVVGASISLPNIANTFKAMLLPAFLGGSRRKREGFFAQPKTEDLQQMADWMAEGKMKAVIDSEFTFEQLPDAFRKQKTGRAKGKIVVKVADDE